MKTVRILLVQHGAYGDCLMVTTITRQIKQDFPGCHLTWAIGHKFRQVIENNPDVDEIWDVDNPSDVCPGGTGCLTQDADGHWANGHFDHVFVTQIYPFNVSKFDGSTRSSMFGVYPKPIRVPVHPILRLLDSEVKKVEQFASSHQLKRFKHVILFECAPSSKQSKLDQKKGLALAQELVKEHSDTVVIVSTHVPFTSPHLRIIDGSCLSFRENAALSHECTLFVGCSSGITWLLTSEAAKKIPMVLFIDPQALGSRFASVVYDFDYWGLPSDHIIETGKDDVGEMVRIVSCAQESFDNARQRYHEKFKPHFWDFMIFIDYHSLRGCLNLFGTCRLFLKRNRFGWSDFLDVRRFARVVFFLGEEAYRVVRSHVVAQGQK
jgi:hypothetical protein